MKMMKKISGIVCVILALSACVIAQDSAADAAAMKKNAWKAKGSIKGQKSPRISAGAATKKFRVKEWAEIEIEYTPVALDRETAKLPFVDGVTVEFIVLVQGKDKTLLKQSFTYNSVALKEKNYAVAYISPSTLGRLVGKKDPGSGVIKAYSAIVRYGGKIVGYETNGPKGLWWEKTKVDGEESDKMLAHTKTPFGFINFDRYPDVAE